MDYKQHKSNLKGSTKLDENLFTLEEQIRKQWKLLSEENEIEKELENELKDENFGSVWKLPCGWYVQYV